jgi:NAD+ synthetase
MQQYDGGGTSSKSRSAISIGVATVNQFVLDFENNSNNIISAIKEASEKNVKILGFPELAICGYSCQDHFFERETFVLSYYMLKYIVSNTQTFTRNMIVGLGCPIMHRDVRYNCTVFFGNGKIFLIRPKTILADDGNYREARWFTPWLKNGLEDFYFDDNDDMHYPEKKGAIPFGVGLVNCNGILIGAEICEELWVSDNIGAKMYLSGADILINCSGSHYEKGKQEEKREVLIMATTRKSGGAYIYSNLEGCDGERLYFDGGSIIAMNGEIKTVSNRYLLKDIQVTVCDINLDDIITFRLRSNSYQIQSSRQTRFPEINVELELTNYENIIVKSYQFNQSDRLTSETKHSVTQKVEIPEFKKLYTESDAEDILFHSDNEEEKKYRERMKKEIPAKAINEICNTAACWLFDYLDRSNAKGFLLPLSGGADSAATACIVFRMCELIMRNIHSYPDEKSRVIKFLKNKHNLNVSDLISKNFIDAVKEICNKVLYTVYLPTNFSGETANLAKEFANQIGSNHHVIPIQNILEASISEITKIPFDIIKNQVKFHREIIQKNKFINDNISQNGSEIYNEQLGRFNASLDTARHEFLSQFEIINEALFNELSEQIYLEKSKPSKTELSPIASLVYKAHYDKFTIMKENNRQVLEWQIEELKNNFKKDIETLNDIYTIYKNKDFTTKTKSPWDIPMQNIQARIRMIVAYLIGQMSITNGYLLNLGSANSDEVYVGYYTKYDASSADLNPIGSLPKIYIQRILIVFGNILDKLYRIINQEPTAELIPGLVGGNQTDEDDIGLKYMEMSELGKLMSSGYGPLDSFMKITTEPNDVFNTGTNASKLEKIYNFNSRYRMNRHKVVVLPPSVHLLSYSPDDNRYNLRPFLYPSFSTSLENEILKGINF